VVLLVKENLLRKLNRPPNQQFKLTVASWVRYALQVVGFRFCYSVFSTYNYDTYQFGYQHELVSFCVY
jgi:fluoride ion exporter CrcB/FEX